MTSKEASASEPAFPMVGQHVGHAVDAKGQRQMLSVLQTGMTLRDYFAGQFAAGVRVKLEREGNFYHMNEQEATELARACFKMADKMLAVRKEALHG